MLQVVETNTATLVGEYNRIHRLIPKAARVKDVKRLVKQVEPIRLELIKRGYTGLRRGDDK
jgi:hypothetical protein